MAVALHPACQAGFSERRNRRLAEGPGRVVELRFYVADALHEASGTPDVGLPEACPVRDEDQLDFRQPRWLPDRLVGAPGDPHGALRGLQTARSEIDPGSAGYDTQVGHPQLGAVPRHPRKVPCQPCQAPAVWRRPWSGIEVTP